MHRCAALLLATLASLAPGSASAQHPETAPSRFSGFLFGDVTYQEVERDSTDGFLIGQLVGHGNARLSDRLSFFGELSATARPNGYLFEVERAILRYDFVDELKLSVGRYHTPISYWNTAYHHGLWLQTSVGRPELIRIGGTFLPVHFVGALAEGLFSLPFAGLSYEAGVGNGRGALIGRGGDAGDVNGHRAVVLGLRLRPAIAHGFQVGGSVYVDRITMEATAADERILSAHAVWDAGAPELIAEYVQVRHDADAQPALTSDGFYAQLGYRLPGALSSVKPYARFERLWVNAADPVFSPLADHDAITGGIRWDFETLAALKAEGRRTRTAGADWAHSLFVQLALVVPSVGGVSF